MVETEPAAYSNLSDEGSTAMDKLLEAMAPVCCIYEVHFRSLVEGQKPATGEDINRKGDVVLVDPPHNVQTDRNADNSEYDVIISEDMREMAKVLENVMKSGAHSHCFAHHSSSPSGTKH